MAVSTSGSIIANKHFEILGTNATNDDVTFASTTAGLLLTPDGANGDQVIVLPHLDTNQTAWSGCKWGTENQVHWECAVRSDAADIDDTTVYAGLKLTNTQAILTDANQAYFIYGAEDDDAGLLSNNANWHFVYSIADADYVTDLQLAYQAGKNYVLAITIDEDRKVAAFIDGKQYSLTQVSHSGGSYVTGSTGGKGSQKSLALTNDIDLIPYVGIMNQDATERQLVLFYEKISRIFFE